MVKNEERNKMNLDWSTLQIIQQNGNDGEKHKKVKYLLNDFNSRLLVAKFLSSFQMATLEMNLISEKKAITIIDSRILNSPTVMFLD